MRDSDELSNFADICEMEESLTTALVHLDARVTCNSEMTPSSPRLPEAFAIHIAIHNSVVYYVLPMTCGAVRDEYASVQKRI
jgi:hypothetical protein